MGANFVCHTFSQCTPEKLSERVDAVCHEEAHEYGHGPYSGQWGEKVGSGVTHLNRTFISEQEACDWVCEKADKWGPLAAVKVQKSPTNVNTKSIDTKLEDAKSKLTALSIQTGEHFGLRAVDEKPFTETVLERVKSGKSKYKSCDACGSKISIEHLKHHVCPVCRSDDFLLTDTDKKRLTKLKEKLVVQQKLVSELEQQRNEKIKSAIKSDKNKDNWYWFVGAWCSC